MNKLRDHLKERGYFFYQQAYGNSLVDWYAAKRAETTRECTCKICRKAKIIQRKG